MANWLSLAKDAFESSTEYFNANYRADLDYSLRAFRNEHAAGSKYLSVDYKARSQIFRPKTRSVIRKNEAAAAVALFSNMDVVNIEPGNPDDVFSVASAAAMKQILEYRLSRTIPAFPLVMGAVQDAQVTGSVCSYQYWDYVKRGGKVIKDQPCIELVPIENIRIDAGASWIDPVNTSPYFCHIIPMYVCDVRAMMNSKDEKTGSPKWKKYKDEIIMKARPDTMDSLRQARLGGKQDPEQEEQKIREFDIVWVLRWCMKDSQGEDHIYYTLGTEEMLTEVKPLDAVYHHGKRPYVIGSWVLETHKPFKSSIPVLTRPIQQETNDVANQRLDNVKFVLNKRWLVARGRQVDVQSLIRNVAGGVTLTTDPKNDIVESNWPDVTSSAYVEQDRLNADFDDLAGNFTPNTKVANKGMNDTLGGSRMAAQGAGLITDYGIRTLIETWWEPVLRQLVLLEQVYESDETVLGVCADKARLFPRFGVSEINDYLLSKEINVSVNVGMGASNPNERFQKFMMAVQAALGLIANAPPNANVQEMIKEIFSNAGYRDGARFFGEQADPRLVKAMQMIQQLQGALQGKQMELQQQAQLEQMKLVSNERVKAAELQVDQGRIQGDLAIRQAEIAVEQQRLELEKLKIQIELGVAQKEHEMKVTEMGMDMEQARLKLEQEQQKLAGQAMKIAAEIEKAQLDLATAQAQAQVGGDNEKRITKVAEGVTQSMSSVAEQIASIKDELARSATSLSGLAQGVGAVVARKSKPVGFRLRKSDGKKTDAVEIDYDDGTKEEMRVV